MPIQAIIQSLEKLVTLHRSLINISNQKTEVVKEGSVEKLQALLVQERRHVQALEQVEKKRQNEVEKWFIQEQLSGEDRTITAMLDHISDEATGTAMAQITTSLTEIITALKQQEQLNQALIQQSMKFVELSLDMMNPSIKNINYGNKQPNESTNRSLFDSKA